MLYVFHGSEINKSLEKARTLVNSLRTKRPDSTFIEIEASNWSPSVVQENVGGQGLFSSKYIIFLNRVTENKEAKETLPDFIEIMNESTNIFILLEGKLNADLKKMVDKFAEKSVETENTGKESKMEKGKNSFNIFSLADAVGSRNSLKSWDIYRQAILQGLEVESIIGTLFWKVKSMILAGNTSSNYSKEELNKLMSELIVVYHDGHRGLIDAELGIEKIMLGLNKFK